MPRFVTIYAVELSEIIDADSPEDAEVLAKYRLRLTGNLLKRHLKIAGYSLDHCVVLDTEEIIDDVVLNDDHKVEPSYLATH